MAKRQEFVGRAAAIEAGRAHFVDEAGTHIAMTRDSARGPRGQRGVDHVPRSRGTVTTRVASLCLEGLEAVRTFVGGTTGDRFVAFVEEDLLPRLRPGDVVVWDGLAAHRDRRVAALLSAAGATIVVLPPYSPDINPIEYIWSLVKRALRSAKARTADALLTAIRAACADVPAQIATATIRHCGFGVARA